MSDSNDGLMTRLAIFVTVFCMQTSCCCQSRYEAGLGKRLALAEEGEPALGMGCGE